MQKQSSQVNQNSSVNITLNRNNIPDKSPSFGNSDTIQKQESFLSESIDSPKGSDNSVTEKKEEKKESKVQL